MKTRNMENGTQSHFLNLLLSFNLLDVVNKTIFIYRNGNKNKTRLHRLYYVAYYILLYFSVIITVLMCYAIINFSKF